MVSIGLPPVTTTTREFHGMAQRVLGEVAARHSSSSRPASHPARELAKRIKTRICDPTSSAAADAAFTLIAKSALSTPERLGTLEAVAREIGDDWSDDATSFLDVTIAMGRLQCVMRRICQQERAMRPETMNGRCLLLIPSQESHTFGVCILEELLRTLGWETELIRVESIDFLEKRLDKAQVDIVCFSWTNAALASIAGDCVKAVERIPASTRPAIISGGHAAGQNPAWLVRLGVDYVCDSIHVALQIADIHLRELRADLALPDMRHAPQDTRP
ncbi:cobalamin-dependent protein [Stappia sp. ES.058]|uniref:cobalamin-dependent protein n=1 Tax=Stappia sp. ES.058 TaxID=1881061 RepID=UPI0012FD0BEB|nr:cobalamin-dependent protein [Stappia sp. ES.058]